MSRRLLCFAAALSAACGSGGKGEIASTRPSPQLRPAGTAEAVRFGPSALHYVIHRQLHIQQVFGGQTQSQDLGARVFVAAAIVGPGDSAGYPATFTVDSVVSDSGTPPPVAETVAKGKGLVFRGRLTATGEFTHVVPSDSGTAQGLIQLLGNFREFMPRVPREGVKLGAVWTDTLVATQRGSGSEITKKSVARSSAAALEDRGGVRTFRLEVSSTYDLGGSGLGGGQPFEVRGAGITSGVVYLAVDGRYVGGETRDSANLVIRLPAQGVSVPVIQVTRLTVAVLP